MTAPNLEEITIPMLAKLLGVSRMTVYRRVASGDILASKIGRKYVVTDRTVKSLLSKRLRSHEKNQVAAAVRKAVADYGDVLKRVDDD